MSKLAAAKGRASASPAAVVLSAGASLRLGGLHTVLRDLPWTKAALIPLSSSVCARCLACKQGSLMPCAAGSALNGSVRCTHLCEHAAGDVHGRQRGDWWRSVEGEVQPGAHSHLEHVAVCMRQQLSSQPRQAQPVRQLTVVQTLVRLCAAGSLSAASAGGTAQQRVHTCAHQQRRHTPARAAASLSLGLDWHLLQHPVQPARQPAGTWLAASCWSCAACMPCEVMAAVVPCRSCQSSAWQCLEDVPCPNLYLGCAPLCSLLSPA